MPASLPGDVATALAALEGLLPRQAIGVVLGSGLGGFATRLEPRASIPYAEVPGFPRPRVPGHPGVLHVGRLGSRPLVVFEGRAHLYEGSGLDPVTFPVRLLQALEARAVLLTTSAGGINPEYRPGDLVLLRDQINLTGEDPARGAAFGAGGVYFPAAHPVYHPLLLERTTSLAFGLGLRYHRGVLAGVRGPSYETQAEVRALRVLGADLVCMSTVLEALQARAAGLAVVGIGLVANCAGEAEGDHQQVLAAAAKQGEQLAGFLATVVEELDWSVR